MLREFRLYESEVRAKGKNKSPIARRLDSAFSKRGWQEKKFATRIVVDDQAIDTPTHAVDCFKGRVALEVEWNNKDPFFDRDLNNFRLLFDLRAIDAGVIVTRCDELRPIAKRLGKDFALSTTWLSKLIPRVEGGGGGGCPILVFGITARLYEAGK